MIQFLNDHWVTLGPLVVALTALVKSEALALDPTTRANGLIHGRRLAKDALSVNLVPDNSGKN